jgi:hypothetical protein
MRDYINIRRHSVYVQSYAVCLWQMYIILTADVRAKKQALVLSGTDHPTEELRCSDWLINWPRNNEDMVLISSSRGLKNICKREVHGNISLFHMIKLHQTIENIFLTGFNNITEWCWHSGAAIWLSSLLKIRKKIARKREVLHCSWLKRDIITYP